MLFPVIMCGGTGSRLWPLSRQMYPKQFLPLTGNSTMLQKTVLRLDGITQVEPCLICNEQHRFLAAEQLRQLDKNDAVIILEPEGRNTAPAIALAALHATAQGNDPLLLVLAADHLVVDIPAFHTAIRAAQTLAEQEKLVTFGIVPSHAKTGYGYIQRGSALARDVSQGCLVERFVEKPDAETAQQYVDSGDYFWNSGMFMFRASCYLEELEQYQPDMAASCRAALAGGQQDMNFIRVACDPFLSCPADSIDYAVMEKTDKAAMVPLNAGWNDIGSWSTLWEVGEKTSEGNVLKGDVLLENTRNSFVHSSRRLVTTVGIQDLIVVESQDAVLVAHKDHVQDVKKIVERLKVAKRSEYQLHREVYRPWGVYDTIDVGERYQVKRITVKPGARLSVQMHHHRAEHWIVVRGTAKVTRGEKTCLVTENQSTYISVGEVHSLENPGVIPLELIEVQSGSYLGEDDIVRFEDQYGRVESEDVY